MFSFLFFFFQSMYCLFKKKMFVLSFFFLFFFFSYAVFNNVQVSLSLFSFCFSFPSSLSCSFLFLFWFSFPFFFFFFFIINCSFNVPFFPTLYLPLCLYLNKLTIGSLPSLFNFSLQYHKLSLIYNTTFSIAYEHSSFFYFSFHKISRVFFSKQPKLL